MYQHHASTFGADTVVQRVLQSISFVHHRPIGTIVPLEVEEQEDVEEVEVEEFEAVLIVMALRISVILVFPEPLLG